MNAPHSLNKDHVIKELATNAERGLAEQEARKRLGEYGPNELKEQGRKSAFLILFNQLKELMVLILLAAAGISFFLNEYIDAAVILVIVVLNTLIGFWQEFKAENAMAALKKLAVPNVRVRRDGAEKTISAKELVPGDLLILEAGNIIPADARIVELSNLKVQEAALTGESVPVEKKTEALPDAKILLADRNNMLYMGTVVAYGRARAVVTATGMSTELGSIAQMLQTVKEDQTPLQKRLTRLGVQLSAMAVVLILIVAGMSLLQHYGLKETFLTAISMAVAAIPEGLPAVVTIALALGAQRMLKKKSLIRNLAVVETLGSVTLICSDKTGTLTQNKMTVTEIVLPEARFTIEDMLQPGHSDSSHGRLLLLAGALCNDAVISKNEEKGEAAAVGDPTETALVFAAQKAELDKEQVAAALPRIAELPFDSDRKMMTTIHRIDTQKDNQVLKLINVITGGKNGGNIVFTKGAVEGLLNACSHVLTNGKVVKMTDGLKNTILAENKTLAEQGTRVIGATAKIIGKDEVGDSGGYEENLTYLGMIGMIDPVRPEAIESVRLCKKAGIGVKMITGDHPLTAKAIAKELGITEDGEVLTGADLSNMSEAELKEKIRDVPVFARVSPKHKMILIDALQEQNQIVAMTGDGVNDAPALKSADIGVSMGIMGTDVARESSDMVLLNDNFATIVTAVKEGRTIFDNIRKFVKYILTGNAGEIMVMLTGPLLGMPIPLLPIQILWINLVTDGAPAIALSYEESEKNVMDRPPFKPNEGVFSRGIGRQILVMGFFIGLLSVVIGFWFWKLDASTHIWQTMVFTTLTFCQMAYALCIRKNQESIFSGSFFKNKMMLFAVTLTFVLQLILIYVPFFNMIFSTEPLGVGELFVCFAAALVVMVVAEFIKLSLRHRKRPK